MLNNDDDDDSGDIRKSARSLVRRKLKSAKAETTQDLKMNIPLSNARAREDEWVWHSAGSILSDGSWDSSNESALPMIANKNGH